MALEISWTPRATRDLANLLEYLSFEWSQAVVSAFTLELEFQIDLIRSFPELGVASRRNPLIRKILVSKHNALYYMVDGTHILILNIFDTRRSDYEKF